MMVHLNIGLRAVNRDKIYFLQVSTFYETSQGKFSWKLLLFCLFGKKADFQRVYLPVELSKDFLIQNTQ